MAMTALRLHMPIALECRGNQDQAETICRKGACRLWRIPGAKGTKNSALKLCLLRSCSQPSCLQEVLRRVFRNAHRLMPRLVLLRITIRGHDLITTMRNGIAQRIV